MTGTKQKRGAAAQEFNRVRWGLTAGIGAIVVASAFMNISGWVAMASTVSQAVANAALSGGMELTALCALPYAGFMARKGHSGRAVLAIAIAMMAVGVNIYATQNFLHAQTDVLVNAIETDAQVAGLLGERIAGVEAEIGSVIANNGGTIPRPVETIERAYSNLDPERNPINMMRRDAEIGLRHEYDRLARELEALRAQSVAPTVSGNDAARSVIPPQHLRTFVTGLELMKATGLYILGNAPLLWGPKAKADHARRTKWAIINKRKRRHSGAQPAAI